MEKSSYQKLRKKLREIQKWIWIKEDQIEKSYKHNPQMGDYLKLKLKELQEIVDEKSDN